MSLQRSLETQDPPISIHPQAEFISEVGQGNDPRGLERMCALYEGEGRLAAVL